MAAASPAPPLPKRLPERLIAHLDMDAFYASVELLRYPDLKGQAVVIGGRRMHEPVTLEDGTRRYARLRDYTGRGVITTSTYAARDLGVFSGMGLMKAALRAPDAILLPTDFDAYRKYSRLFKAAVAEVAPVIEDRGIDEIYIDLSDVPGVRDAVGHDPLGGVRLVAREIKNSVLRATGLTCSIGITPNKLLSKIASETGQARWHHRADGRRDRDAHLAPGGAQDQRHRPEGQRPSCSRSGWRRSARSPPPSLRC